jgi:hypothetical protein
LDAVVEGEALAAASLAVDRLAADAESALALDCASAFAFEEICTVAALVLLLAEAAG